MCAPATGYVSDAFGLALSGVQIAWKEGGRKCSDPVTTDASGRYEIEVEVGSKPTVIKASSSRTSTRLATVLADVMKGTGPEDSHDFRVLYLTRSTAAAPAYLQPGTSTRISAETSAPPANTKLLAEVGATTTPLMRGATSADGWTAWSVDIPVDIGAGDGNRSALVCGVAVTYTGPSCTDALSKGLGSTVSGATQYTVDGIAPDVVAGRIYPLSGTNTQFASQPLLAQVNEMGGMYAGGARFTLTDVTTGTSSAHNGVAWDGQWVKTSPVALVDGHTYRVALTVTDRAGNATTVEQNAPDSGGGFRSVRITNLAGSARAVVDAAPTQCTVGAFNMHTPAKRPVTCTNVRVRAAAVPVVLSNTYHGGSSSLTQEFDISGLAIQATVLGADIPDGAVRPLTGKRTINQPFSVIEESRQSVTATASAGELVIPTLTSEVPASADGAYVSMPATTATAKTPACLDPAVATAFCSPDPIPPVASAMAIDDVVVLPGQVVATSYDQGGPASVMPMGSTINREPFVRRDGSTVQTLAAAPPEPISIPGIQALKEINRRGGVSSNIIGCLTRVDRPTMGPPRFQNGTVRLVERGELSAAGCSGGPGGTYDPAYDGRMNGCIKELDGARTEMQPSTRPEAYKEYHLVGCFERSFQGHDDNKKHYADWSDVEGLTCERETSDCLKIQNGWDETNNPDSYYEVDARLTTITTAHSYYNGFGMTDDRYPDKPETLSHSCTTETNRVGFTVKIEAPNGIVGGTGTFEKTKDRTECKEAILPSAKEGTIHGVDWQGTAPNGRLGMRRVIAANRTDVPLHLSSGFKYHMDIETTWENCLSTKARCLGASRYDD